MLRAVTCSGPAGTAWTSRQARIGIAATRVRASVKLPAHALFSQGHAYIVVNAASGTRAGREKKALIDQALSDTQRQGTMLVPESGETMAALAGRAASLAQKEGGVVIAVGGDGTINAVASAAIDCDLPLGVVPEGTFNLFARDQGISEDPVESINTALTGQIRPVQAGRLNEHLFLVNASIGQYPKLLDDREEMNSHLGRGRFIAFVSALRSLSETFTPYRMRIVVDGCAKTKTTPTLFVCNNRLQLSRLGFDEANALDRRLAMLTSDPISRVRAFQLLARGFLGHLNESEEVGATLFANLSVTRHDDFRLGRRPLKVAIDGEIRRVVAPILVSIEPRPLRLIAPRQGRPGAAA